MLNRCLPVVILAAIFAGFGTFSSQGPTSPAAGSIDRRQIAFTPGFSRAQQSTPEPRVVFSADQASTIAQTWVAFKADQILEWQDAIVGPPVVYHDLDGLPAAYVFSVFQSLRDVGYVILTYEACERPVVEYSTNPAPHLRCGVPCQTAAKRQGLTLITDRPIFLGPMNYYFEAIVPFSPQTGSQRWLAPMGVGQVVGIKHQRRYVPAQETIVGTVTMEHLIWAPSAVQMIYNVPDHNQFYGPSLGYEFNCYSGCTPTAATNIAHFWASAGYQNMQDAFWPDTTAALRTHMDTFCFGDSGTTWNHKTAPGLVAFSQSRGYDFQSLQYCWPTTLNWVGCDDREFNWQRYTEEIDQCRPALISISNHPLYGSHTVTGVGYDSSGGDYYIVHDNWSATPREVWILHEDTEERYRFLFPFIPPHMDHTPPVSATVHALPPYQATTKFDVSWQGADDFPGVGSFDVQYKDGVNSEWQWWLRGTTDSSAALDDYVYLEGGHTYFVRARARDKHCNTSDWSNVVWSAADADPPNTIAFAQQRYRTERAIPVAWGGSDDASGIASYDIWAKAEAEEWELWQHQVTTTMAMFTDVRVGGTYYFSSIGTDRMGREEVKSPDEPDTMVTVARHSISGRILGNRDAPTVQTQINSSSAYEPATTDHVGHYTLFFPLSQEVTVTVSTPLTQSTLPPMKGIALTETVTDLTGVDLVLSPPDNLIRNSHFEAPNLGAYWVLNGVTTPTLTRTAHTGDFAVALGVPTNPSPDGSSRDAAKASDHASKGHWAISQTVMLSSTIKKPTLSWFYAISGTALLTDTFVVNIREPGDQQTYTVALGQTGWNHGWLALNETVTHNPVNVSFHLRRLSSATPLLVFLDEVTVGSGDDGPAVLYLPLIYQ